MKFFYKRLVDKIKKINIQLLQNYINLTIPRWGLFSTEQNKTLKHRLHPDTLLLKPLLWLHLQVNCYNGPQGPS